MIASCARRVAALFAALLFPLSAAAATQNFDFRVLIDTDNDATTGCTVATATGLFKGVEQILITRVSANGTTGTVTGVTRQICTDPIANAFSAELPVDGGGWPITMTPGGSMLVETHIPNAVVGSSPRYRLNFTVDSPLYRLIQTPTNPDGTIKDNSILKMLENSLADGILRQLHVEPEDDESIAAGLDVLKNFWRAVEETFPTAWGLKPEASRLMHGVGVVSMGFLMDAIAERYLREALPTREHFLADLAPLAELCHWTSGYWQFGVNAVRKWNELQNTAKDTRLVTNHLLYEYRRRVLEPASAEAALQRRLPLSVS